MNCSHREQLLAYLYLRPRRPSHKQPLLLLIMIPAALNAVLLLPAVPGSSPRATAPRCELAIPSDAAFVVAALALAGGAGLLQYSVSAGDKGINAFLMKEKSSNPFYDKNFQSEQRAPLPRWLRAVRLPRLDFVEVYGEPDAARRAPSLPRASSTLESLYRELDAAVEREDYAAAADVKKRIDAEASNPR